jgi:hypothetical protein
MHRAILYFASSDSAPGMGSAGNTHHVTALRVEAASGALSAHGDPIPLPTRPIQMTTDIPLGTSSRCFQQRRREARGAWRPHCVIRIGFHKVAPIPRQIDTLSDTTAPISQEASRFASNPDPLASGGLLSH